VQTFVSQHLIQNLSHIVRLIAAILVISWSDWKLGIFLVGMFPVFYVPARFWTSRVRANAEEEARLRSQQSSFVSEALSVQGALLSRIFGTASWNEETFERHSLRINQLALEHAYQEGFFWLFVGMVRHVKNGFLYAYGAYLIWQDRLSSAFPPYFRKRTINIFGWSLHACLADRLFQWVACIVWCNGQTRYMCRCPRS
jgi:ATP-binding cassette subfamily B protein